jgi:hypothetical protein
MLYVNTLYKHVDSLDSAFDPIIIHETEEGLKMTGIWFIVTSGRPRPIAKDNIFIKRDDIENWQPWHPSLQ